MPMMLLLLPAWDAGAVINAAYPAGFYPGGMYLGGYIEWGAPVVVGATVRALVLDAGMIKQYTSGGARLRLDAGVLTTTAGGRAIVWDDVIGYAREAADGETVLEP